MAAGSILVPQIIPLRVPTPGQAKHEVDTNTLVEIKSDTPDVTIYYTIDGSKPQLIRKVGYGDHNTFKYNGPIVLPEGKITVKALAVTKDCRESAIVTKVFVVEYVTPNTHVCDEDNDENFLKDLSRQEMENGLSDLEQKEVNAENKFNWNDTAQEFQANKVKQTKREPGKILNKGLSKEKKSVTLPLVGPHAWNNYLSTSSDAKESTSAPLMPQSQFVSSAVNNKINLTSTQLLRIQRETDFLRCAQCLAPCPSDPFARFCQECGSVVPPVPGSNLPPPEGAQMGLCIKCQTLVPVNTPACIVCDAPIAPQLQPQANIHLKDKVLCPVCGAGNPIHINRCVICESLLPEAQKLSLPPRYFTCCKCSASHRPSAQFCGTCGVRTEPPSRLDSQDSLLLSAGDGFVISENKSLQSWQQSVSVPISRPNLLDRKEQGTQTIGLFYPSSKLLGQKQCKLVSQEEKQNNQKNDHKPLLTAISPGRGYWRTQLDHVCAHLRSYAQNNLAFRTLIGEPQLGKLISATIHKDEYQVSLQLNYALAMNKDILTNKQVTFDYHGLNASKAGRGGLYGSQTSLVSEETRSVLSPGERVKRMTRTRISLEKEDKLSTESRRLLKEVGPNGQGQAQAVQQLIDEGADPNCTNNDDQPSLTLAVLNKHHEAIPVLVQRGAAIDRQSGPLNNTALHEAILLGLEGLKCTEALLGCNANIKKKNARGLSACDLALKSGNNEIASLFASKLGQKMLDKIIPSEQSPVH